MKDLKEDSHFRAAFLEGQIEKLQKDYDELRVNQMRDRLKFQEDIAQEIKIHEAMAARQSEYIELIKKELIVA